MSINEKLLQILLEKNPDLAFGLEESYPFRSTFPKATSLGPIMELRAEEGSNALTAERAVQTVDYWRETTKQLLSDEAALGSQEVRASYSKLISSQAGLLEYHQHAAEAEQAYRLANEICPTSPEAVFRYINLLVSQQRFNDAALIAQNAIHHAPDNRQFLDLAQELNRLQSAARN